MPHQLAQALLKLLEDDVLRETMGRAGRERAMAHFTWDKVAETMLKRDQALSGPGSCLPTETSTKPLPQYASAHLAS